MKISVTHSMAFLSLINVNKRKPVYKKLLILLSIITEQSPVFKDNQLSIKPQAVRKIYHPIKKLDLYIHFNSAFIKYYTMCNKYMWQSML